MHSVLIFIQQVLFPPSKTALFSYLERKGVTYSKSREITEKWNGDVLICDWYPEDYKDIKKADVVPIKNLSGVCSSKPRRISGKEMRSKRVDIMSKRIEGNQGQIKA